MQLKKDSSLTHFISIGVFVSLHIRHGARLLFYRAHQLTAPKFRTESQGQITEADSMAAPSSPRPPAPQPPKL